jgi:spermidine synthase
MPRAFTLLDRVETPEGPLELRKRGERDFMISIAGRVLMSSIIHRSEVAVAELGCAPICKRPAPRVLIGGLGLGFTLRAALDLLPRNARVEVAELNAAVHAWCQGPLSGLTNAAVADPRVAVVIADVATRIRQHAHGPARCDAIILDLYVGPKNLARGSARAGKADCDPLYGHELLRASHAALSAGGVYAVWAEEPSVSFERRLQEVGFRVELVRPQGGGPRHAVYIATKAGAPVPAKARAKSVISRR